MHLSRKAFSENVRLDINLKIFFFLSAQSNDTDFEIDETDAMDVDRQSDSDDHSDIDDQGDAASKPTKKMGRPPKKFAENGPTQRRAKLQKPYSVVESFSTEEEVKFNSLLGHLMKMHIYKDPTKVPDAKEVALAEALIDGINPLEKQSMPIEKAMYLAENVVHGETKWDKFKKAMDPLSRVTTNHALRMYRKDFYPETG